MSEPSRRKRRSKYASSGIGCQEIDFNGCVRQSVGKVGSDLHESIPFGIEDSEDGSCDQAPEVPVSVVDLSTLTFDDEDEIVYIGSKEANNCHRTDVCNLPLTSESQTDLDCSHSSFRITNSSNNNIFIKHKHVSDESDCDADGSLTEKHETDAESSSCYGLVEQIREQCSIVSNNEDVLSNPDTIGNNRYSVNSSLSLKVNSLCTKPCFVKCERLDISKLNAKNNKGFRTVKLPSTVLGKFSKRNRISSNIKKNNKVKRASKPTSTSPGNFPGAKIQRPVPVHRHLNIAQDRESSVKDTPFVKILPSTQTHSQLQTDKVNKPNSDSNLHQKQAYVIRSLPDLKLSFIVPFQQCVNRIAAQSSPIEKPIFISPAAGQTNSTNHAVLVNSNNVQTTENSKNSSGTLPENPIIVNLDPFSYAKGKHQEDFGSTQLTYRESIALSHLEPSEYHKVPGNFKRASTSPSANSDVVNRKASALSSCNVRLMKLDNHPSSERKTSNESAVLNASTSLTLQSYKQDLPVKNVSKVVVQRIHNVTSERSVLNSCDKNNKNSVISMGTSENSEVHDSVIKRLTFDSHSDQSVGIVRKDEQSNVHEVSCNPVESKHGPNLVDSNMVLNNCGTKSPDVGSNFVENCMKKEITNLEECASEKEAIDFLSKLSPSEFIKVCSDVISNSFENSLSDAEVDSMENSEKEELAPSECSSEKEAINCIPKNSEDLNCNESNDLGNLLMNSKPEVKSIETNQTNTIVGSTLTKDDSNAFSDFGENSVPEASGDDKCEEFEESTPSPPDSNRQASDNASSSEEFCTKQKEDFQVKSVFEKEMWDVLFNNTITGYGSDVSDEIDVCNVPPDKNSSSENNCNDNSNTRLSKGNSETAAVLARHRKRSVRNANSKQQNKYLQQNSVLAELKSEKNTMAKNASKLKNKTISCRRLSNESSVSKTACKKNAVEDSKANCAEGKACSVTLPISSNRRCHKPQRSCKKGKNPVGKDSDLLQVEEADEIAGTEQKGVERKRFSSSSRVVPGGSSKKLSAKNNSAADKLVDDKGGNISNSDNLIIGDGDTCVKASIESCPETQHESGSAGISPTTVSSGGSYKSCQQRSSSRHIQNKTRKRNVRKKDSFVLSTMNKEENCKKVNDTKIGCVDRAVSEVDTSAHIAEENDDKTTDAAEKLKDNVNAKDCVSAKNPKVESELSCRSSSSGSRSGRRKGRRRKSIVEEVTSPTFIGTNDGKVTIKQKVPQDEISNNFGKVSIGDETGYEAEEFPSGSSKHFIQEHIASSESNPMSDAEDSKNNIKERVPCDTSSSHSSNHSQGNDAVSNSKGKENGIKESILTDSSDSAISLPREMSKHYSLGEDEEKSVQRTVNEESTAALDSDTTGDEMQSKASTTSSCNSSIGKDGGVEIGMKNNCGLSLKAKKIDDTSTGNDFTDSKKSSKNHEEVENDVIEKAHPSSCILITEADVPARDTWKKQDHSGATESIVKKCEVEEPSSYSERSSQRCRNSRFGYKRKKRRKSSSGNVNLVETSSDGKEVSLDKESVKSETCDDSIDMVEQYSGLDSVDEVRTEHISTVKRKGYTVENNHISDIKAPPENRRTEERRDGREESDSDHCSLLCTSKNEFSGVNEIHDQDITSDKYQVIEKYATEIGQEKSIKKSIYINSKTEESNHYNESSFCSHTSNASICTEEGDSSSNEKEDGAHKTSESTVITQKSEVAATECGQDESIKKSVNVNSKTEESKCYDESSCSSHTSDTVTCTEYLDSCSSEKAGCMQNAPESMIISQKSVKKNVVSKGYQHGRNPQITRERGQKHKSSTDDDALSSSESDDSAGEQENAADTTSSSFRRHDVEDNASNKVDSVETTQLSTSSCSSSCSNRQQITSQDDDAARSCFPDNESTSDKIMGKGSADEESSDTLHPVKKELTNNTLISCRSVHKSAQERDVVSQENYIESSSDVSEVEGIAVLPCVSRHLYDQSFQIGHKKRRRHRAFRNIHALLKVVNKKEENLDLKNEDQFPDSSKIMSSGSESTGNFSKCEPVHAGVSELSRPSNEEASNDINDETVSSDNIENIENSKAKVAKRKKNGRSKVTVISDTEVEMSAVSSFQKGQVSGITPHSHKRERNHNPIAACGTKETKLQKISSKKHQVKSGCAKEDVKSLPKGKTGGNIGIDRTILTRHSSRNKTLHFDILGRGIRKQKMHESVKKRGNNLRTVKAKKGIEAVVEKKPLRISGRQNPERIAKNTSVSGSLQFKGNLKDFSDSTKESSDFKDSNSAIMKTRLGKERDANESVDVKGEQEDSAVNSINVHHKALKHRKTKRKSHTVKWKDEQGIINADDQEDDELEILIVNKEKPEREMIDNDQDDDDEQNVVASDKRNNLCADIKSTMAKTEIEDDTTIENHDDKIPEQQDHRHSHSIHKSHNVCQTSETKIVSPLKLIKENSKGKSLKPGAKPEYRVELSPEESVKDFVKQEPLPLRRSSRRCNNWNRSNQSNTEQMSESNYKQPSECLSIETDMQTESSSTSHLSQTESSEGSSISENSPINKGKESTSEESLPELDNDKILEIKELLLSVSARNKRKRSESQDKVLSTEEPSGSAWSVPEPSLSSSAKKDDSMSEPKSMEPEVTIKVEPPDSTSMDSEPIRYSSSGRKICRKTFGDEVYTPPVVALKASQPKENKLLIQLSPSGRKIPKRNDGDDVHTPSVAEVSPVIRKNFKSEKRSSFSGDIIKPFSMGWMREVVYRATNDSPQVGKRKADIYYFTPEGTKLRSMPEIGAYLNKNKITNLQLSNFTFAKEVIYREPFEKERAAKIKVGTPSYSTLKPKKQSNAENKSVSVLSEEKRVPKMKLPFIFPSLKKSSKEDKPKPKPKDKEQLKRPINKQVGSNENVTPKRKKNEPVAVKKKLDLNPLLMSTKKLLQPQHWEADTIRRCSKQCVDSQGEDPTLQCKKCLCLFHPRCVSINPNKLPKDFICKLCATGIEGSPQSTRQDVNVGDSNHVSEKSITSNSCEEVSEINLVPEVVLEQNPHDPPIKQLEWRTSKHQPNMASFSRPYCGPPPLKRAPDTEHKKMENPHGFAPTSGFDTNNGITRSTPALCAALTPGGGHKDPSLTKLPPLLPGTLILRNRLTQNKQQISSSPVSHPLNNFNVAGDSKSANPPAVLPYLPFPRSSNPVASQVSSNNVNSSTKAMPPPGKNVRAPRFILPASTVNAPTTPMLLQEPNKSSAVQQVKLSPYSNTIVVSQTASFAMSKNSAAITFKKVDNVSSSVSTSERASRQPLKLCDFNIVPAGSSNQVSSSGADTIGVPTPLPPGTSSSSECVNGVTGGTQPENEKSKSDLSNKDISDADATGFAKRQPTSARLSDVSESSETSVPGDQYSASGQSSRLKDSITSEDEQTSRTDIRVKVEACKDSFSSSDTLNVVSSSTSLKTFSCSGVNKLMWGFNSLNLIFEKFPVNDLLRCTQVCRSWRNLASQHFLWRDISLRDLKIRNWKRCANALRRFRTSSLDLRGLQHVTEPDSTWKEFISIIKFLKHLEKIVFGQVPPSVITALSEFLTQLRSLECYCMTQTCEEPGLWNTVCAFDFSCIKNLKQLERLRIRSANELKISSNVLSSSLSELRSLQHLSLTSFTDLHGSQFGFLKNLPNLLSLELGDTKYWKSENFAFLAELPNLQALRLDNGGDVSDTGLADAIMKMKDLQELRLINYKIPSNLGSALKKARNLRRLSIWPDNSDEAARVNYNALEAVSKVKKITYFCWGILIADGSQDLTDGSRPLVDVLKHGSDDGKGAVDKENILHLSSVDLLERLYYLLPSVEVQVECIHRSKFNKYWTVHK